MSGWVEVCSGLFVGEMGRLRHGEFAAVLAISPLPPVSQDGVKHLWLKAASPQVVMEAGETWLAPRWLAGQRVLAQSIPTLWADLAAGACLMHLGATPVEAITLLRRARPGLRWSDDSLLEHLEGR